MKKIKLFFISIMFFSISVCFADAVAEERQLNDAVLGPIIDYFPEGSSYTRVMSKKITDYETANKKQFTKQEALDYQWQMEEEMEQKSSVELGSEVPDYICTQISQDKISQEDYGKGFVAYHLSAWQNKVIQCDGYALFALLAFYFNKMNNEAHKENIKMFKEAIFVETTGYGHVFILVEGDSGTMFAVDPWIRKVIALDSHFFKLSDIKTSMIISKNIELEDEYNRQLNLLFRTKGKDGLFYYDALYVNHDTKWELNVNRRNKVRKMIKSGCSSAEILYDALKKWFPLWQIDYNTLVNPNGGGSCSVS